MKIMGLCFVVLLLIGTSAWGQTPQSINYQAVARDASGNPLQNRTIRLRFSIIKGTPNGPVSFSETQETATDMYGRFTVKIGEGIPVTGSFADIHWPEAAHYLRVEIDPDGGFNFLDLGTTRFVSVPYAFVTDKTIHTSINDLIDVQSLTPGVGQVLKWNGNSWIPAVDSTGKGGTGTITAVTAGPGLTGGGNKGNVTLSLAESGVTSDNIRDRTMTAEKIASGQVVKSLNGLHDQVTIATKGGATIASRGDTIIITACKNCADTCIQKLSSSDGSLLIFNPRGPETTVNLQPGGVTNVHLAINAVRNENMADSSITSEKIRDGQVLRKVIVDQRIIRDSLVLKAGRNTSLFIQGNIVTISMADTNKAWLLQGNSGTNPGTNFLGTTDNQAFEIRVFNRRALRLEPVQTVFNQSTGQYYRGVNVIGGLHGNTAKKGVMGACISGGGVFNSLGSVTIPNTVYDMCGTIGGGAGNQAGSNDNNVFNSPYATVAGGMNNSASRRFSTVGGGEMNIASYYHATVSGGGRNKAQKESSTVGGGNFNIASGEAATIGGGSNNQANADFTTVGGGYHNTANSLFGAINGGSWNKASGSSSTVGGGSNNSASGYAATVPGGFSNLASGRFSFAAGRRAKANHIGTFVWADSTFANFTSTGPNQFLVRASGGVGIGTNNPQYMLHVNGKIAGVGAYVNLSDRRFKRNVAPISNPLETIMTLRGVEFEWRKRENPELNFSDKRQIGLIAQEVEKVLPEIVYRDREGIYSISYDQLVPVLIEALKAQHVLLEEQRKKLRDLEKSLGLLAALMNADTSKER